MDDYQIADNKSIKELNKEYQKILNSRQNIRKQSIELSKEDKDKLENILNCFNIEKQIICFFNNNFNGNNALKECIEILKDIFNELDIISTKYISDYTFINRKKVYSFRELFEQNFMIIKNINHIDNKEIKKLLINIKTRQIELILILLPFII